METVPGQGVPPGMTQPLPANQIPQGPPGFPPQGGPIQIQLPIELQQIMQQWPGLRAELDALKAKPASVGGSPWQGFALFLLGGSLMAIAVFVWPYLGKVL